MEDIQAVLDQLIIDEQVHHSNVQRITVENELFDKSLENKEFYFKILLENKDNLHKNLDTLRESIDELKVELKTKKEEFAGIQESHMADIKEKFDEYLNEEAPPHKESEVDQ